LEVPSAVYDHSGTLVAEGAVNGEPIELAAGGYRVVVPGSPPRTFTEVVVEGEEESILDLDKAPVHATPGGGER
jgi:hypothetical protein